MAELAANGLRFHVQTLGLSGDHAGNRPGDRPKVVMIHGFSVDLSCFYVTIAASVAVESDVHLYDLRGHGRSEIPSSGYLVVDHVADLVALLDAWGLDEPVHLLGNSFGGIVALFFAHYHPERVASLFLIEPHLSGDGWGKHMSESFRGSNLEEHEEWLSAHQARLRWARRIDSLLRTTSVLDDLASEPGLPDEWLAELRCPVFSIYGSDSDIVDRAAARDRSIPGCEPCLVPDATHMLLAEKSVIVRDHAVEWIRHQHSLLALGHG